MKRGALIKNWYWRVGIRGSSEAITSGQPSVIEHEDFPRTSEAVVERIRPIDVSWHQAAKELAIAHATLKRLLHAQSQSLVVLPMLMLRRYTDKIAEQWVLAFSLDNDTPRQSASSAGLLLGCYARDCLMMPDQEECHEHLVSYEQVGAGARASLTQVTG